MRSLILFRMIEGKEVIFVLGGPGSGKGTQATRIAEEFNFGYAAAGDLLRKEANTPGSPNGQRIAEIIFFIISSKIYYFLYAMTVTVR